jgi:hypothetical protein
VTVPGPGRLAISGRGVRAAGARMARSVRAAGTLRPLIAVSGKRQRTLDRNGTVTITPKVTYTPTRAARRGRDRRPSDSTSASSPPAGAQTPGECSLSRIATLRASRSRRSLPGESSSAPATPEAPPQPRERGGLASDRLRRWLDQRLPMSLGRLGDATSERRSSCRLSCLPSLPGSTRRCTRR